MPGWDETNFFGWDRDREIRPTKIQYETEKKLMLIFLTTRDREETVWFLYVRDEGKTESISVFFYDRDENKLLIKKKTANLATSCFKNTHPDQDETETRLRKIEANEMRPRRDCPKIFHLRQDKFQNFVRDRDETESFGTFSLETKTKLRLSSFTDARAGHPISLVCIYFILRFCLLTLSTQAIFSAYENLPFPGDTISLLSKYSPYLSKKDYISVLVFLCNSIYDNRLNLKQMVTSWNAFLSLICSLCVRKLRFSGIILSLLKWTYIWSS